MFMGPNHAVWVEVEKTLHVVYTMSVSCPRNGIRRVTLCHDTLRERFGNFPGCRRLQPASTPSVDHATGDRKFLWENDAATIVLHGGHETRWFRLGTCFLFLFFVLRRTSRNSSLACGQVSAQ